MKKSLLFIILGIFVSLSLSSCAYRADLTQGNVIEQKQIDLLRVGMTPEQVRYVLGTPMLIDVFDNNRWYYVQYTREGWSEPKIQRLIAVFANGRLIDIQGDYKKAPAFDIQES